MDVSLHLGHGRLFWELKLFHSSLGWGEANHKQTSHRRKQGLAIYLYLSCVARHVISSNPTIAWLGLSDRDWWTELIFFDRTTHYQFHYLTSQHKKMAASSARVVLPRYNRNGEFLKCDLSWVCVASGPHRIVRSRISWLPWGASMPCPCWRGTPCWTCRG